MSGSNTKFNYTIAKILHWVAFFIIVFNLLSGWRLDDFDIEIRQILLMFHSGIGLVILIMMLYRWWWRTAHKLYVPQGWTRRPSMLLQWILYPLTIIQVFIGVANAAFIDYQVKIFGLINVSALAPADETMHKLFMEIHGWWAITLIVLIFIHGVERSRSAFTE